MIRVNGKEFTSVLHLCQEGYYSDIMSYAEWTDHSSQYFLGLFPLKAMLKNIGVNTNITAEEYQSLLSKCSAVGIAEFRLLAKKQLESGAANNFHLSLTSRDESVLKPIVPLSQTLTIETIKSLKSGVDKYGRSGAAENINQLNTFFSALYIEILFFNELANGAILVRQELSEYLALIKHDAELRSQSYVDTINKLLSFVKEDNLKVTVSKNSLQEYKTLSVITRFFYNLKKSIGAENYAVLVRDHPHLGMFQDFAVGIIVASWEHICSDDQFFTYVWSLVDTLKTDYSLATSFNLKEIFANYFNYDPANNIGIADLSQRWQKICDFLCAYFSARDTLNIQVGLAQAKLSNPVDNSSIDLKLTAVKNVVDQFNSYVLKNTVEKKQKRSSFTGFMAGKVADALTKELIPKVLLAQQLQTMVIGELKLIKSLYENIETPDQGLIIRCHKVFSDALYAFFSETDANLGAAPSELLEFTNDLSVGLRSALQASAHASRASILVPAALLSSAGLNSSTAQHKEANVDGELSKQFNLNK